MLGVVKLLPDPNNVPPVEALYHLIVPVPDADKLTVPVPHLTPSVPVGTDGTAFTVAVTAVLVADVQPEAAIESNA